MRYQRIFAITTLLLSVGVQAENGKPDLKDPTIWQEKPASQERTPDPCEVLNISACPGYEATKTDIQKEQLRREQNRRYKDIENGKWRGQ